MMAERRWRAMGVFMVATGAILMMLCGAMVMAGDGNDGLKAIVQEGAVVEKVAGEFQFTEGPVWDRGGFLLFSDIPANTLYQWTPGSSAPVVFRKPTNHTNGNTLDREGRLIS